MANEVVIVSAVRSAVGRAGKGALAQTRPDELAGQVIRAALARVPGLTAAEVDDVILAAPCPRASRG
jgi:acetyl-CoA acetyltransferase